MVTIIPWINPLMHSVASSPLLCGLQHIISSLKYFRAEHVLREANFVADCLADNAVTCEFLVEFVLPLELNFLLQINAMGLRYVCGF